MTRFTFEVKNDDAQYPNLACGGIVEWDKDQHRYRAEIEVIKNVKISRIADSQCGAIIDVIKHWLDL